MDGSAAGGYCRTGGEDIVHNEEMPFPAVFGRFFIEVSALDPECAGDIEGLLTVVEACLRACFPGPEEDVGTHFGTEPCGNGGGNDFRLVIASAPKP